MHKRKDSLCILVKYCVSSHLNFCVIYKEKNYIHIYNMKMK